MRDPARRDESEAAQAGASWFKQAVDPRAQSPPQWSVPHGARLRFRSSPKEAKRAKSRMPASLVAMARRPKLNARPGRRFDGEARRGVPGAVFSNRSGSICHFGSWHPMDSQTKHEIWILALGAIMLEAPFLAVAALAFAGH